MAKNKILRSISLLIIALSFLVPTRTFAGCEEKATVQKVNDLSWIKSSKTIYLAKEGKIFQTQVNAEKLILLAEHGFDYISSFDLSPDSKYIAYGGFTANKGFSEYLYDLERGKDYKLPKLSLAHIDFSPDSTKLVLTDDRWKGLKEFVIMNLKNQTSEDVPFPPEVKSLKDFRSAEAKWSLDGKNIYLGIIAFPMGAYYKYTVDTKKLIKIDGRFHSFHDYHDLADAGVHFIENGIEIPIYQPPCLQWQCAEQGKAMTGERAVIDKSYNLIVTTPEGKTITIDKGEYNFCEGDTIRILSWLENGKYLIYQKHGITYIYGVEEGKKSILFGPGGIEFGWDDQENRKGQSFP